MKNATFISKLLVTDNTVELSHGGSKMPTSIHAGTHVEKEKQVWSKLLSSFMQKTGRKKIKGHFRIVSMLQLNLRLM